MDLAVADRMVVPVVASAAAVTVARVAGEMEEAMAQYRLEV